MAVQLNQPLSIWMQLASLFFTCSGINGDLLVIRLFLFLAYVMLFLSSALGGPLWPDVVRSDSLSLDGLVWAIIGMYVHGSSLACLFLDERPVPLGNDEAALWRLLYRTGGLSQKLFETEILPYLKVTKLRQGEAVDTLEHFSIVYRGRVRLKVVGSDGTVVEDRTKVAGEMFDFKHLDLLSSDSVFFAHQIQCSALSPEVTLFQFRKADMGKIANHPFGKSLWQALLINNLSNIVEEFILGDWAAHNDEEDRKASHPPSDPATANDNSSSNDDVGGESDDQRRMDVLFGPLREWELPPSDAAGSGSALARPVIHVWKSWVRAFSVPWPFGRHPTGIRQTQLRAPPPFPPASNAGRQGGGGRERRDGPSSSAEAGRRGSVLELLAARSFHRWSLSNRRRTAQPTTSTSTGTSDAASRLRDSAVAQPENAIELGYGAVASGGSSSGGSNLTRIDVVRTS
jgi:hypothetical protein